MISIYATHEETSTAAMKTTMTTTGIGDMNKMKELGVEDMTDAIGSLRMCNMPTVVPNQLTSLGIYFMFLQLDAL